MNSQNILKFWGSKLDLKLDSSEFHDYEVHKTESDYNAEVLDFNTPITYTGLSVDTTALLGKDCVRNTISLDEYDNRSNDASYPYSGYSWTLPYSAFTGQLNNSDKILKNDVYEFIDSFGRTHYFMESDYNNSLSNPFSLNVSGFTTGTTVPCFLQFSGTGITSTICCPRDPVSQAKPWAYQINHGQGVDNCDYSVQRRTPKGWTIDLVLNKSGLPWSDGNMIYYWGVRNETDIENYADNNLSFSFTNDGRVRWQAVRYSGVCNTETDYTESYYISSGQTPVLCTNGTSRDFNLTISFERNSEYTDCNLENDGGWNDLIPGLKTIPYTNTTLTAVTSTQTTIYSEVEELNKKWAFERSRRLGTLKIYLNGRVIYKLKNWEEVIPSTRGNQPFIQSWAGGTQYSGGIHNLGTSCFNFKNVQYYEQPLDYVHVRHHYLTSIKPNFNINECNVDCIDSISGANISNITFRTVVTNGSIRLTYDVSLNEELPYEISISFKNKLRFLDLTTISVPISFTIPPNTTNYQYTHTEDYNFDDLDYTYFEFLDLKIISLEGISFSVSYSFVFRPSNDFVNNIIPNNDIINTLIPNDDSTYTLIPSNDFEYSNRNILTLEFNDIINADTLVGGVKNVKSWNTFFDLPSNGRPFTSVIVDGNNVQLLGGSDIHLKDYLFSCNLNLLSIVDNGSVTSAGTYSFGDSCEVGSSITTVDLPSLTTAGNYCFGYCISLTTIDLPSLTTAGNSCFIQNSTVTAFSLPSLTTAGNSCFQSCSQVTTFSLPSLITAGNNCFYDCTSVTTFNLPLLTTAGEYSFYHCNSMTTFSLPSLLTVGYNCFAYCTTATVFNLPSCTDLGGTVDNDGVFNNISGNSIILKIPSSLLTCKDGSPDGDIDYLQTYNTVTINPLSDGLTPETAGESAYQIKTDVPSSTDGLYWIKNDNISGGTPFQIYADMTTDGGGWTLLLTNQNTGGWTYENSILLNEGNPVISDSNYSIVTYGDYIKSSGTTFQYMIDANQRNQFGGIWSAPQSYSFVSTGNTQTNVTLDTKFGTWNYDNSSIEQRMPWRGSNTYGILTTSENSGGDWWGTLVTNGGWSPVPWINSNCGNDGCMPDPGIIWYWVR